MADDLNEKGFKLRAQLFGEEDTRQRHEDIAPKHSGADFRAGA